MDEKIMTFQREIETKAERFRTVSFCLLLIL
jgi:hypothetical protein